MTDDEQRPLGGPNFHKDMAALLGFFQSHAHSMTIKELRINGRRLGLDLPDEDIPLPDFDFTSFEDHPEMTFIEESVTDDQ